MSRTSRCSSTAGRSSGTRCWPRPWSPRPSCSEYALSQFSFIGIYAIVCLGLMLLSGFTGQVSLGHAGFLAMGAYTEAWLQSKGWPFALSLPMSALVAGITGILVGLPALRIKGMYLAIATLAFGFIIEEAVVRAEHITGGNAGIQLGKLVIAGIDFDDGRNFYYLVTDRRALRAGRAQPAAQPHRSRLCRHPRFRGVGAEHGHQPGPLQDRGLRPFGGTGRHRRRALRAQDPHHHARPVRLPAIDRAA
jgi:hypothetical protein